MSADILARVHAAALQRVLFLPHAVRQMARSDRMIAPADVRGVVSHGEVIEDYPDDARGHSCLLLGFDAAGRPIHVVCSPSTVYLAIITAYVPDPRQWSDDFRTRS